jgi:hypothetical protein
MQKKLAPGTALEMAADLLADVCGQLVIEIGRQPAEDFDAGRFGMWVLAAHGSL